MGETGREQLQRWEMKVVKVHGEARNLRGVWPLLDRLRADPRLFATLRHQQKTEADWR
jgi:hypothetical protein